MSKIFDDALEKLRRDPIYKKIRREVEFKFKKSLVDIRCHIKKILTSKIVVLVIIYACTVCFTFAQVTLPDVIADSAIYEIKLGRQCVRLDSANRVQIATLEAMISGQARLITLERSQISEYKAKEDLWQLQFENQGAISTVEKKLLKTKIRALRRWLTVSVAGNVILIVILLI